jgi:hypothetical protein
MIAQPAWAFLESFDQDDASPPSEAPITDRVTPPGSIPLSAAPSVAQLEEAYNRGVQVGVAEGWGMREAEFAHAVAQADARVEQAKIEAADALIHRLQSELQREVEALGDQIADRLMDLLTPVLRRFLNDQMFSDLLTEARAITLGKQAIRMEIGVPADCVERVRNSLSQMSASGDLVADVRLSVTTGPEITLHCEDTVIETRLGAWMALLGEAIGDDSR